MAIDPIAREYPKDPAKKQRLATECSKLDQDEERALADLGLEADFRDWPEYE